MLPKNQQYWDEVGEDGDKRELEAGDEQGMSTISANKLKLQELEKEQVVSLG